MDKIVDDSIKQIEYISDMKQEISNNKVEISVFCIENVAAKLEVSGQEVYEMLTKKSNIGSRNLEPADPNLLV